MKLSKKMKNIILENKKISIKLLINYIIVIILLFLLVFFMFIGYIVYSFNKFENNGGVLLTAEDIIEDDYNKINFHKVTDLNGYIVVLDNDLKVIKENNSQFNLGDKMIASDLIKMHESNYSKEYHTSVNEKEDFILIVGVPYSGNIEEDLFSLGSRENNRLIFISIMLFLFLSILTYAKLTSKTFVKPINELLKNVNKFKSGDYSARVNVSRAVTEIAELQDAFNLMADKIEKETELKEISEKNRKQLILDISHDLKNPLTSIMGYSEYLIKNIIDDKDRERKILKIINDNSVNANQLIKVLFQYSRIESEAYRLDIRNQDICEFLKELIAGYIPIMEEKGIEYEFNIGEKEIIVPFDSHNLYRAISNLINNSIKYNDGNIAIYITLTENDNNVVITIRDNGIGIPKKLINDIFNPFVRVDSSRNSKTGGTGLGLAITNKIIEKHGGKIKLISDENEGCEFIITLPKNNQ